MHGSATAESDLARARICAREVAPCVVSMLASGALRGGDTIGSMPEGATLTYADLASFPDDGLRRELIDGELIVSPSPRTRHQQVLARLYLIVGNHIAASGGGEAFFAPLDVVFTDRNVVEPDLLFVADDQREILTETNVQGSPALVVEVVSDPRLERVRKRDLYARFGVPEYWVVAPDADRVEVYRLRGDAYAKPEILEPGETLTYDRLPGLRIDLRRCSHGSAGSEPRHGAGACATPTAQGRIRDEPRDPSPVSDGPVAGAVKHHCRARLGSSIHSEG